RGRPRRAPAGPSAPPPDRAGGRWRAAPVPRRRGRRPRRVRSGRAAVRSSALPRPPRYAAGRPRVPYHEPVVAGPAEVEIWRLSGRSVAALTGDRVTVGKAAGNDIALEGDPTVSRLHAVLERFEAGWCVSDLGSSNGTFVNGERIWSSH